MKAIRSSKHLLIRLMKHKKLVIMTGAVLGLSLLSATTYAYYRHHVTSKAEAAISKAPSPAPEKAGSAQAAPSPSTSVEPKSPTATPDASASPAAKPNTPPQPVAQQSTADRRASLQPKPPTFTAGRLTGGVACYTGVYAYTLGTAAVSAVNISPSVSLGFSWQIELSNGTIHQTGSNQLPRGTTAWPDFPNTASMPSSFGYVYNPPDGLSARLVITSPNYSAGAWANPVPNGSGTSCHASPDYIPPEIRYE